jgi:hypothetical protein
VMDVPREPLPSLSDAAAAWRALVLATFAECDAVVTERDSLLAQNDQYSTCWCRADATNKLPNDSCESC